MRALRNQLPVNPARGERISQVATRDAHVIALNIEELEERIAPARPPPLN